MVSSKSVWGNNKPVSFNLMQSSKYYLLTLADKHNNNLDHLLTDQSTKEQPMPQYIS